jgi:uncharacterized protein involved in type VI secretion and phage assembly
MSFDDFMFQQPSDSTSSTFPGVVVGIVTDNKDPEKLGRVKMKIPIIDNEHPTDWARIATLMAGKERGSMFIPEVGDEVLVAFHMGDVREPIVIGVLWNKDDKMPSGFDDKNNIRKFVSRQGHEIIFGDDSSDAKVTIKTKKGQTIEFADKADTVTIKEQSGNNIIELKGGSANEISIKSSSSKITLNAKGDIVIDSPKSLKVKSTQVEIEASATMKLKASATLDIQSDGMINIKGSMVKIN